MCKFCAHTQARYTYTHMCLAIPGQITEVKEDKQATVDFGGIKRSVDTTFIEDPAAGEWVLIHVGCAIQKVEEAAAKETYRLLYEMRKEDLEQELADSKTEKK